MAERKPEPFGSPVTARAVCLGLMASVLVDLAMAYNDYYLSNSLLIGNHFPVVSIVAVVALILGVNGAAKRWLGVRGLEPGELLLVWGMIGVAGGICSAGIMRYFPSWVVAPVYYGSRSNEYDVFIWRYLPDWMVVSRDPASPAVRWFMEGLPRGASIPWGAWVTPILTWFAFTLCLFASNFALVSVFFHQWTVRDRLIFPVVQLPLELVRGAAPGRFLNAFLRNRLTWVGVALPCLVWGINGLKSYLPGLPSVPVVWSFYGLFADRPWSEFNLAEGHLYFSVIGLTFLLTTEIAFSLWFFFVLYRLSYVWIAFLGSGATGYWGEWGLAVPTYQTAGAMAVIAAFLFWTARRGLAQWWRRALTGTADAERDSLRPRWALAMIVLGLAGMIWWFLAAGASWWVALLGVLVFLMVLLVLTRIVAESGLMFVQTNVVAYDLIAGLFPPAWLTGGSLNSLMMQKAVLMNDLREILMPYVMNGLKAAAAVRLRLGQVLAVFALTAVVALAISAYGRIGTYYKYGGVNMDQWANVWSPTWFLDGLRDKMKQKENKTARYEFVKAGDVPVLPVSVAHLLTGGAATAGMLWMRSLFVWWPLHPFGLVMCGTWAMSMFWFSIALGWLAKTAVMTFGGAAAYRRVLPLFLGLVLGESLIAAFWMLLGLATGTPGSPVLPN